MNSVETTDTTQTVIDTTRASGPPGWWGWLQNRLWPSLELRTWQIERRLRRLNRTLEEKPDAAPAYVLRGEIYLDAGFYTLALEDFARALALAQQQLQTSDWGVLLQVMQDRAQVGLKAARRGLRRARSNPA